MTNTRGVTILSERQDIRKKEQLCIFLNEQRYDFPWITEGSSNCFEAYYSLGRQSFLVAHGGSSKGNMQMGQMLKISTGFDSKTVETLCCQGPWRR